MTMRVVIGTSTFAEVDTRPLALLKHAGVDVFPNPWGRRLIEEEIIEHLKGADGLLAGLEPLNAKVLSCATTLKAIARVGTGMENVDVQFAESQGIKVSNTPDAPAEAVAEMTVGALLCLSRKIHTANTAMHEARWEKCFGRGIASMTVLVIGAGRIGQRVARLLGGMGSRIMFCDPVVRRIPDLSEATRVRLEEGLAQADAVTVHVSGERSIIGDSEFALMKDGVLLLNSSRGGVIDEVALENHLSTGKVEGAWLDVYSAEPYSGRLTQYPQVLLTPHISSYTNECRAKMEVAAVENVLRDLKTCVP